MQVYLMFYLHWIQAINNKFYPLDQLLGEEAGRAFCKAADMSIRAREKSEVPSKLVEASKMYKKCAPDGNYLI